MQSENYYRRITCELVNNSGSELEVLRKIDLIRNALRIESEIFNQLSQLKPRLRRMLSHKRKGVLDFQSFDINMNKIVDSTNQILRSIELKDIVIGFEFDERDGIIYHITNSDSELVYKYIGELRDYRPHGKGIAKYRNGDTYHGSFKKGNRDGVGTLYNQNNAIIHEGNWRNNKFLDKNSVKYFPNLRAAANSIEFSDDIQEMDFEIMKIPQLHGDNMFAFPIEGDSMEPNFLKNDIVICKETVNVQDIRDGKVYVIFHEDRLVIKRVKKISEPMTKPIKYTLISDNYTKHYPYEIIPDRKTKFFNVLMQLKSHL